MSVRILGLFALMVVTVGIVGCGGAFAGFNDYVTPKKGDANYQCVDSDGMPHADWVNCKPFDGSNSCCLPNNECRPNRKCAYMGNTDTLGAAPLTERIAVRPQ